MNIYDKNRPCPKCGETVQGRATFRFENVYFSGVSQVDGDSSGEHIEVVCSRCSAIRRELPLDKEVAHESTETSSNYSLCGKVRFELDELARRWRNAESVKLEERLILLSCATELLDITSRRCSPRLLKDSSSTDTDEDVGRVKP